jgi:type IV pilus assembly protein PilB
MQIEDELVQLKIITQEQLDEAVAKSKTLGQKQKLIDILFDLQYLNEEDYLKVLADKFHYEFKHFHMEDVNEKAVKAIPKKIVVKHSMVGVQYQNGCLILATNDPFNLYAIEDIKSIVSMPIKLVLTTKNDIQNIISKCYAEEEVKDAIEVATTDVINNIQKNSRFEDYSQDDSPIVNLINSILLKGKDSNASDIHIEPFENEVKVRFRIDGQLIDYLSLDINLASSIVIRIKVISDLDIAEKRIPQDGHFAIKLDTAELNLRVSTLPTIYGEKIVMRFLNKDDKYDNGESYGMSPDNFQKMQRILRNPNGIIYITGPTGSGKTTTLYMILQEKAKDYINVSSIEDPVEKPLARINQTQVNELAGMTFAAGLRALLRQDPDVIMIGETRDLETASISVTAAITGHLVFSTLHTNDSVSSISRLEDMGLEPYQVATSVKGIVAQRLVKKICPFCKQKRKTTVSERILLGKDIDEISYGCGCEKCNNTGYKGRIAIHEILEIDDDVRKMISKRVSDEEIAEYLRENNKLTTLKDNMVALIEDGTSTIDELTKVVYVN